MFYSSLIVGCLGLAWLIYEPGFEPVIVLVGAIFGVITSKVKPENNKSGSELMQTNKEKIANELTDIAGSINKFLANYTVKLEDASWKPHISTSNREQKLKETDVIESEINQKFKERYESKSLKLLKQASMILERDDYDEKTKCLSGYYLLGQYCKHLVVVAEELRGVH